MGRLWRGVRDALRTGGIVLALAAAWGAAPASAATTYVAGPGGTGEACSEAQPCSIAKAVGKAANGDAVRLLGGEYRLESSSALPIEGISISKAIDFGGAPGAVPLIETTFTQTIRVNPNANASIHDLKLIGRGSLSLGSGSSADRVYVSMGGEEKPLEPQGACELGRETILRDSVCWAHDEGNPSAAAGVKAEISNEAPLSNIVLRNVTAIATDSSGDGLAAFAAYGAILKVNAMNVIARSEHGADVSSGSVGNGSTSSTLVASHSSYATVAVTANNSVTPTGTEGNQSAAPHFANPATGDFHQVAGSPTIDGGIDNPLDNPLDLDGAARSLPGCIGGPSVPDIGAYEASASAACPVPPPPPKPPRKRKPRFRLVSVKLHGSSGTVKVEVPSAGNLTLTGSGIKLATRKPSKAQILALPIKPWATTLAKLKKAGKAKIKLKVVFEPKSGGKRQKAKTIILKAR